MFFSNVFQSQIYLNYFLYNNVHFSKEYFLIQEYFHKPFMNIHVIFHVQHNTKNANLGDQIFQ